MDSYRQIALEAIEQLRLEEATIEDLKGVGFRGEEESDRLAARLAALEREQLTQLRRKADRQYDRLMADDRTQSAFVLLPPTVANIEAVLTDLRLWIGTRIVREWEGDDAKNMPPGVVVNVSLSYLDAAEADTPL